MNKAENYLQLAMSAVADFPNGKWTDFLNTASSMYKYPYSDQIMIYTQRPQATACAQMGLWNRRLGRWIKRGSKGIALLDLSGRIPRLRYVFDIADTTEGRNGAQPVYLWQLQPKDEDDVLCKLKEACQMQAPSLPQLLFQIAGQQTNILCAKAPDKILEFLNGSSVCGMEDFRRAAAASAAYVLMKRCNIPPQKFLELKALNVAAFDTTRSVAALGRTVNAVAGPVLRQIERIVKSLAEQQKEAAPQIQTPQEPESMKPKGAPIPAENLPMGIPEEPAPSPPAQPPENETPLTPIISEEIPPPASPIIPQPMTKKSSASARRKRGKSKTGNLLSLDFTVPEQPIALPNPPSSTGGSLVVPEPSVTPLKENYRITGTADNLGGPKKKCGQNIAAIRTLKAIENEDRAAAPEEQAILAQYTGWGGLPQAFDSNNPKWNKEYEELKALLTPAEYAMARASTLTAFYTPPNIIKAIYEAMANIGFQQGRILEPSCGTGNFFGLMPEPMRQSSCYGVEIDNLSGRIARQLYLNVKIEITGYENTKFEDGFFDAVFGNIPFGSYSVADPRYDKYKFSIHEYFIAKMLDNLRGCGIAALIVSKFLLDKKDTAVRRYIAQRADFLGAIRLPCDAFMQYAGTEATADILFLQKKKVPDEITVPDWLELGVTGDGIPINQYFAARPEMVLGKMEYSARMYGNQKNTSCAPWPNHSLEEQLNNAICNIQGTYEPLNHAITPKPTPPLPPRTPVIDIADYGDSACTDYSYAIIGGKIYYQSAGEHTREEQIRSGITKKRLTALIRLRDCVRELIHLQLKNAKELEIQEQQAKLNCLYDSFIVKFGLISSPANKLAFYEDSSYYLLCSLEILDEDGRLKRKADMFTMRTIGHTPKVTAVDTAIEALAVSIGERGCVDIGFMSTLLSKPGEIEPILEALKGVIFKNPTSDPSLYVGWQTADEYLSGNVRQKLSIAMEAAKDNLLFESNVAALTVAQPKDLEAHEIDVQLGSTWIDKKYIQQFMEELLQTPESLRSIIQVKYSPQTAEWFIEGKRTVSHDDVLACTAYGTNRANAYALIEESLNLRDIRIYDTRKEPDGTEKRVLNRDETILAAQKQTAIRQKFREWIFSETERRQTIVGYYNEHFNAVRPRAYDGSNIIYHGMNPAITLRPHQINAVARILYGGNTLLAHAVGAGKTFEMIAAAMESKYLGLCSKNLFVVPNHLTEQWATEFLRLYPAANLLVTTKKDFEKNRRKEFCSRIATGNYDAIIIGHSQFEKIPISYERQKKLIKEQIGEIVSNIEELKQNNGENFTIKQMEHMKKSLQVKLERLNKEHRKDRVVTFEESGVDRLFVDEAHSYKNLFLFTKMRNVAGLSTSSAQKSSDMFLKCRYLDEITQGKGIIFATGTPISNSMTELYTLQRYLQYALLEQNEWLHFDCWASQFGESVTQSELAPEGSGYRARTRFARFFNLPELMNIFKSAADIQTADMLNLPVPKSQFETIVAEPTEQQKEMLAALSERAHKVHLGMVEPWQDNMLKITTDGRKLGLDQRLMNPLLPDVPNSKLNLCVQNILRIWEDTAAKRLTQLVFCDFSTPNRDQFNVYDDMKEKLLQKGVPKTEIAFIHDANTEIQKKQLFAKVRAGKVRILFGSTAKMGAGTNVQDRLIALHDLDCPWRPGDLEQRSGRIIRQGNANACVYIYRYVTNGTFDSYLYQTIETKQRFISQIMTSKSPVRSCEDIDQATLSYAEIKALCAGDPKIKEKMELDVEVARLNLLKADFQSHRYRLEDQLLSYYPKVIREKENYLRTLQADLDTLCAHPLPENAFCITLQDIRYDKRAAAGAALLDICRNFPKENKTIGTFRSFDITLNFDSFMKEFHAILCGLCRYDVKLGTDPTGNILRIEHTLENIPERIKEISDALKNLRLQKQNAEAELKREFPYEEELAAKNARLAELNLLLNMEHAQKLPTKNPAA